jgi:hypothetical protein
MARKDLKQLNREYDAVVEMLQAGKTSFEIEDALGLNQVQLKSYLAKAAIEGVTVKRSEYLTVRGKSLPKSIREFYNVTDNSLFKIEKPNSDGIGSMSVLKVDRLNTKASSEGESSADVAAAMPAKTLVGVTEANSAEIGYQPEAAYSGEEDENS